MERRRRERAAGRIMVLWKATHCRAICSKSRLVTVKRYHSHCSTHLVALVLSLSVSLSRRVAVSLLLSLLMPRRVAVSSWQSVFLLLIVLYFYLSLSSCLSDTHYGFLFNFHYGAGCLFVTHSGWLSLTPALV